MVWRCCYSCTWRSSRSLVDSARYSSKSYPRSEAHRIFVGAEVFSSPSKTYIPFGLAIWSSPGGADVEIDGRFVGNTESSVGDKPEARIVIKCAVKKALDFNWSTPVGQ